MKSSAGWRRLSVFPPWDTIRGIPDVDGTLLSLLTGYAELLVLFSGRLGCRPRMTRMKKVSFVPSWIGLGHQGR
jgi:hypothetical protein